MAVATLTPLPPAQAVAALQARGARLDPTFSWQDAWEEEHARMFTVAKSAGFDILKDVHDALVQALAEGRTFEDFARDLRPALEAKGWWGRKEVADPATGEIRTAQLGSTRRLRTIFDTNLRVSYATGHWAQFERNRKARPFLRYVAILDGRARPAHAARHNVTLPIDDAFWDVWSPPCGWGCRCTLQSLSQRDFDRMKGDLKLKAPPDTSRPFTNRTTGEIVRVPDGIDPGWGYNPGRAGWQATPIAAKTIAAPPAMAAAAAADPAWPAAKLTEEFSTWFAGAGAGRPVERTPQPAGVIDATALAGLDHHGTRPRSGALVVRAADAPSLAAASQSPGAAGVVARLPEALARPRAVLFDRERSRLVYVIDVPDTDPVQQLAVSVALDTDAPVSPAQPLGNPISGIAAILDPASLLRAGLLLLAGAL